MEWIINTNQVSITIFGIIETAFCRVFSNVALSGKRKHKRSKSTKQRSSFLKAGRLAHEKLLMEEQRVIDQAAQAGANMEFNSKELRYVGDER